MNTQRRFTLPGPLTESLVLTVRNRKRITAHLTTVEEQWCFQENTLTLSNFFNLTIPRVLRFKAALGTVIVGFVFFCTVFTLHQPIFQSVENLLGAIAFYTSISAYVIWGAWREHALNTRYAKAIAALYACKAFKPYCGYLTQLEPQLHGYFSPSTATRQRHYPRADE